MIHNNHRYYNYYRYYYACGTCRLIRRMLPCVTFRAERPLPIRNGVRGGGGG